MDSVKNSWHSYRKKDSSAAKLLVIQQMQIYGPQEGALCSKCSLRLKHSKGLSSHLIRILKKQEQNKTSQLFDKEKQVPQQRVKEQSLTFRYILLL